MKKISALIFAIFALSFASNAQTVALQTGSIIKGKDGKAAAIVFYCNASTKTAYAVSLSDASLPWSAQEGDVEAASNSVNSAVAGQDMKGVVNTAATVAQFGLTKENASTWCFEYNAGGLSGWYLPSCGELNLLLANRAAVNEAIAKVKGATPVANAWHWSSSEGDATQAWCINFSGGDNYPDLKSVAKKVRAIRQLRMEN